MPSLAGWAPLRWADRVSVLSGAPAAPCDAWLRGYRDVLPLSDQDAAEIPTFVLLRRLQLVAWVGSHRFADSARDLGEEFTKGACGLAEQYLLATSHRLPRSRKNLPAR